MSVETLPVLVPIDTVIDGSRTLTSYSTITDTSVTVTRYNSTANSLVVVGPSTTFQISETKNPDQSTSVLVAIPYAPSAIFGSATSYKVPAAAAASSTDGSLNTSIYSQSSGVSARAKVGIVSSTIPIFLLVGVLVLWYHHLRRNRHRARSQYNQIRKDSTRPELYGDPGDPMIKNPGWKKAELSSGAEDLITKNSSTQLDSKDILEANSDRHHPAEKEGAAVNRAAEMSATRTAEPSKPPNTQANPPVRYPSDAKTNTVSTQSATMRAELAEEADSLVQELGLLAMRKRRLEKQTTMNRAGNGKDRTKAADDFDELVEREKKVRSRLDEIEIERKRLSRSALGF